MHGNHVVILPKFDAEATLAAVEEHAAELILLVPTMMQRITRLPDVVRNLHDLSSPSVVWHMASPCPPWLKETWIHWLGGEKIYELYAGTEAQAVTIVRGDEWLAKPGTVGRPVIGEMRIQHPDTFELLPPGEIGEVFMRAPANRRTYEYVGAEPRLSPDGWESLSCAAIGLPDEDLGSRIHAGVQVRAPIDPDELRTFLAERLVRYKIPRSFEFVDEVVRDDAGKVRRTAPHCTAPHRTAPHRTALRDERTS